MEEEWKDIEGWEGYYRISNLGNLASVDRVVTYPDGSTRFVSGIKMKWRNSRGYLDVYLKRNGFHVCMKAHRLVAMAFIPNPQNKPFVNHIDANKHNNKVTNLEWVTASENSKHAYNLGLFKDLNKIKYPLGHQAYKPIYKLDLNGNVIDTYSSATEAGRLTGIHRGNIYECLRGQRRTSMGFMWRHVHEE